MRREALLRKNRQPRHPCTPRVYPGRLHSGSAPTYKLGHTPFPPEPEIAILTPAAPILNVLPPHSKSGLAMSTAQGKAVAHHGSAHRPSTACLDTLRTPVILDFAILRFSRFAAQGGRIARSPQEGQNRIAVGVALRDLRVVFVVRLAILAHRHIPDHARTPTRRVCPFLCRVSRVLPS